MGDSLTEEQNTGRSSVQIRLGPSTVRESTQLRELVLPDFRPISGTAALRLLLRSVRSLPERILDSVPPPASRASEAEPLPSLPSIRRRIIGLLPPGELER